MLSNITIDTTNIVTNQNIHENIFKSRQNTNKENTLPSPSPKPSKIVLAQLLNLQRELGIVNQTRIEILWNLEDSDEEVWWPATIHLDENSLHKVNTIIIEGEEEVDSDPLEFELVSIPIKYDYNKNFPEYKDEKDLLSTVSILHEHKLLENSV